jgi:hypothetical protein
MRGVAKMSAAVSAAPNAGSRRAGAGTIGEAAAIARRAAASEEHAPISAPIAVSMDSDTEHHPPAQPEPTATEMTSDDSARDLSPVEPTPSRKTRGGVGQLKDLSQGPDRTAVHLILAGRAYAYGQSIVHKEEEQKPGDVLAIES